MLTLMMADHGADVIKIEPPGIGEPSRAIGYETGGQSVWFRNTHRGKRSIQLDLKAEPDRARLHALAREADVFIEAFRPGVAARLGLDAATLRAENPGLVYCSISAFGQTGAYRDLPAHDIAVQALAGVIPLNEGQDGKPAMPNLPAADALASLTALAGVLMALYRRQSTGHGDVLDIAMLDSLLAWTPNVTGRIFATGQPHIPKQERSWGGNALYNLYETADSQWIALGGAEPKFARNLLDALGRPDLIPLAAHPPGQLQDPLRDYLRETFKTRSRAAWEAWFAGRDIAFAPARTLLDAFNDPDMTARGMTGTDEHGNRYIGTPIRFRDEPAMLNLNAPGLGEHQDETWRERQKEALF
jgi:crotonobetainyl-CoA:carnitine CoA-transferase CaiB-like acyl-CoA transferase